MEGGEAQVFPPLPTSPSVDLYFDSPNTLQLNPFSPNMPVNIHFQDQDAFLKTPENSALYGSADNTKPNVGNLILGKNSTFIGNIGIPESPIHSVDASQGATLFGKLYAQNVQIKTGTLGIINIFGDTQPNINKIFTVYVENGESYGQLDISQNQDTMTQKETIYIYFPGYVPNNTTFTLVKGPTGQNAINPNNFILLSNQPSVQLYASGGDDLNVTVRHPAVPKNVNNAFLNELIKMAVSSREFAELLYIIENLSPEEVAAAYQKLSPASYHGPAQASKTQLTQSMNSIASRIHTTMTGINTGDSIDYIPILSHILKDSQFWIKWAGSFLEQHNIGDTLGYTDSVLGSIIGVDGFCNPKTRLGLGFGYLSSNIKMNEHTGRTNLNSYQGILYGLRHNPEKSLFLNGTLSAVKNNYKSARTIKIEDFQRTALAEYEGEQYSLLLGGGHLSKAHGWHITPHASLQYTRIFIDPYTETNAGDINLNVSAQNYDALVSDVGIKALYENKIEAGTLTPEFRIDCMRDFIAKAQQTNAEFVGGGGSFSTNGLRPSRTSFSLGTSLNFISHNHFRFLLDYDWEIKKHAYMHHVMATSTLRF